MVQLLKQLAVQCLPLYMLYTVESIFKNVIIKKNHEKGRRV